MQWNQLSQAWKFVQSVLVEQFTRFHSKLIKETANAFFPMGLKSAKARKGIPMYKKLAQEILEANEGTGNAIKKRDDVHKMAQANKAFAHLARFT